MAHLSLVLLAIWSFTTSFLGTAGRSTLVSRQSYFVGNTSVLPPGWSGNSECYADCGLFGPSFTDSIGLTIESCVAFCNEQGSRMAGLKETECRCANIFTPDSCFESDGDECFWSGSGTGCPGNPIEACGIADFDPPMFNIFFNLDSQFRCSDFVWPGGAPLAPGSWRFSYFYNDSFSARALPHSAINLPTPLPQGILTVEACLTACENEGFTIAGVEFGAECFCGNAIESNSQPITDCSLITYNAFTNNPYSTLMPCTGDSGEYCGGPDLIAIYTLPGTGLVPLIPFDSGLDGFCGSGNCVGST